MIVYPLITPFRLQASYLIVYKHHASPSAAAAAARRDGRSSPASSPCGQSAQQTLWFSSEGSGKKLLSASLGK